MEIVEGRWGAGILDQQLAGCMAMASRSWLELV